MDYSQILVEKLRKSASLDPQEQSLDELAGETAAGFVPGVGTALAARDFERARRDDDYLGMGLSALGAVPVVGGVAQMLNRGNKARKMAEKLRTAQRGMVDVPGGPPKKVYHGGTYVPGTPIRGKLYTTPNQEMAASYTDMHTHTDGDGWVSAMEHNATRPAPEQVIREEAARLGINNEDYTPASIFDSNLHSPRAVQQLIDNLTAKGYDHAVLGDIGFGVQIDDDAVVLFPNVKTSRIQE